MSLRRRFLRGGESVHTDFERYLATLAEAAAAVVETAVDARRDAANGAATVAYFDLDRTLISGYSVAAIAWERMRRRAMPFRQMLSSAGVLVGYGLGRADYLDLLTISIRDLAGESELALTELGETAFRNRVQRWIYPQARALIDAHREAGHHVVIVTSATRFQAAPVARDLGVEDLWCTELDVDSGVITGKAVPCFGPGKLAAAEQVARQREALLEGAYFYSDSSDDLPLLEAVGRPVVVNPRAAMARLAVSRGWPCLMFGPPGDLRRAAA